VWYTLGPHGPYIVSQNYNRHACENFCSCKLRISWISPVFVRTPLKNFQTVIIISLLKKQNYSPLHTDRGERCSKNRTVDPSVIATRDQMKRKPSVLGHILQRGGANSHTMQPWYSEANCELKNIPLLHPGVNKVLLNSTHLRVDLKWHSARRHVLIPSLRIDLIWRSAAKG
jgi:hypothetical protein